MSASNQLYFSENDVHHRSRRLKIDGDVNVPSKIVYLRPSLSAR